MVMPDAHDVLGLSLNAVDESQVNRFIASAIDTRRKVWVGNLNAHAVNLAVDDPAIKALFNTADLVFCDGKGLSLVLGALGIGHFPQVTYNRWLPGFLAQCAARGDKLFFLGSEQAVVEEAMAKANALHPGVVVGCHHGFFASVQTEAVVNTINASGAHILLLGMGMPRQEKFIHDNRERLKVNVMLNGGGCFMFYTGRHPMAPAWMSRMGMEWLYRWWQEPQRLASRYLIGNPKFLWRVFWWRLRSCRSGR